MELVELNIGERVLSAGLGNDFFEDDPQKHRQQQKIQMAFQQSKNSA